MSSLSLTPAALLDVCNSSCIAFPVFHGGQVLSLDAVPVLNYSLTSPSDSSHTGESSTGLDFCNVTVTYTHPGWNDSIEVVVGLPLNDWNGRFQALGGGGWRTGPPAVEQVPAIADGYSTAGTNGGHSIYANSPDGWGHVSPGNINWYLLQDFASVALNELSIIGKQITTSFYGTAPKRSYWNGCSTGGRQGLMLAQRFPDAFDGIVAIAPAINWARLLVGAMWPQQYMRQIDFFPLPCELDYVNEAVLEACDGIDGVEDGIISSPSECNFDPESLVGKEFSCNGTTKTFAPQTAAIAEEFWRGAVDPAGRYSWYGLYPGTEFFNRSGLAGTICQNSSQSSCTGRFEGYFEQWTRYYVMKDADFDVLSLTEEDFFNVMRKSIQEFDSVIGTADPDLSQFHKRGGKMITWHGLTDQLISPNGTVEYYERVMDVHPDAHDFYRYFEAPGVAHCSGGPGPRPRDDLGAVVKWVEEGEAPDVLEAISPAGDGTVRNLCPYPSRQVYVGGDPKSKDSFACE